MNSLETRCLAQVFCLSVFMSGSSRAETSPMLIKVLHHFSAASAKWKNSLLVSMFGRLWEGEMNSTGHGLELACPYSTTWGLVGSWWGVSRFGGVEQLNEGYVALTGDCLEPLEPRNRAYSASGGCAGPAFSRAAAARARLFRRARPTTAASL